MNYALLFALFAEPTSYAETYNVPLDFASIQDAVDGTVAGDVIEVDAGVYAEPLDVPHDLTIVGLGGSADNSIVWNPLTAFESLVTVGTGVDLTLIGFTLESNLNRAVYGGTDSHVVLEDIVGTALGVDLVGMVALSGHSVTIRNCTFDGATGGSDGGLLWMAGSGGDGVLTIEDSSFGTALVEAHGGHIWANEVGRIEATNTTFSDGTATIGGSIWATSTLAAAPEIWLDGVVFTGNSASDAGGALWASGYDVTVVGSEATGSTGGGFVLFGDSSQLVSIDSTTFDANQGDVGAHIYSTGADLFVSGSMFASGVAAAIGGAIMYDASPVNIVDIRDSEFIANEAAFLAGAVMVYDSLGVTVAGNTFTTNTALTDLDAAGGALLITASDGPVVIDGNAFAGNSASANSGALGVSGIGTSTLTLTGNDFSGNIGTVDGSAVAVDGAGPVDMSGNTFTDNTLIGSTGGGVAHIHDVESVTVGNDVYCNNTAPGSGAGLLLQEIGTFTVVQNSLFVENNSAMNGGGLWVEGIEDLQVINNTFLGNNADGEGAASYFKDANLEFINNLVASNTGAAVSTRSARGPETFEHNDWFDNVDGDFGGDLAGASHSATALMVDPELADWSADGDCSNDQLWPTMNSPLVDAGHPKILDPDGTISDIGAFGGPESDGFEDTDGDGTIDRWDCAPKDGAIFPGAKETCNDIDDDCNGQVDDGLPFEDYYIDFDGDGFGVADLVENACAQPSGYVTNAEDCDDDDPDINPQAAEILDNDVDEDCDGVPEYTIEDVDTGLSGVDADDKDDSECSCSSSASPAASLFPVLLLTVLSVRRRRSGTVR